MASLRKAKEIRNYRRQALVSDFVSLAPLTVDEYRNLKALALKSAEDFRTMYEAVPDKNAFSVPERRTFYGLVPRSANDMYIHTRNVNEYYFAEIRVKADNLGSICECRKRGFEKLEQLSDYLLNATTEGSYGESWTLRKVLRRFIWHDRIHAKAMHRMALKVFGAESIPNPFCFRTGINEHNINKPSSLHEYDLH